MDKIKILTIKDLYIEIEENPDLRSLGKYKVVRNPGRPIIPIDVNLEGKDINLGEGDFTDAFTAFADTKVHSLDLNNCVFTDLYLDYLQADVLRFSDSRASRVYFDKVKIKECNMDNFICPEVYFDEAELGEVSMQNLESGILHLDNVKVEKVAYQGNIADNFRFATNKDGTKTFGDYIATEPVELSGEKDKSVSEQIVTLTLTQFIEEIKDDSDLRRLGKYKVIDDDNNQTSLNLYLEDKNINLGEGDFTALKTGLSFGDTIAKSIDFDRSIFFELNFENMNIEKVDLSNSRADLLSFGLSRINECFLSKFHGFKINGGESRIRVLFGENSIANIFTLDSMMINQFNVNDMQLSELKFENSQVEEVYMSRGEHIQKVFCGETRIKIMNLHESIIEELHFEQSKIKRALINKTSVEKIYCEELETELFYVGHHKNEMGDIDFGEMRGIGSIEIEKILPKPGELEWEGKRKFKKLIFGSEDREQKIPIEGFNRETKFR